MLRFFETVFLSGLFLGIFLFSVQGDNEAKSIDKNIIQIAAGGSHSLALTSEGQIVAWGSNLYGELGDGTKLGRNAPIVVSPKGDRFSRIAGGFGHSLALRTDGTVWSCGLNMEGQLGHPSDSLFFQPVLVTSNQTDHPLLRDVIAIAAGEEHSLALKSDGTIWFWGFEKYDYERYHESAYSVSVDSGSNYAPVAVPVPGLSNVVAVAAGGHFSLALKNDGTVWGWGKNERHALGRLANSDKTPPQQITFASHTGQSSEFLTNVVAISAGFERGLALKKDGTIWTWGDASDRADLLVGVSNAVAIAVGRYHSLALTSAGTIWAWGGNDQGQIGNGTRTDFYQKVPFQIPGITNAIGIAAGVGHSMALLSDGSVRVWGGNRMGQVGTGCNYRSFGISNAVAMAAGGTHGVALCKDRTLLAWGENSVGQLGNGTMVDQLLPVSVYRFSDAVRIAAGNAHTLVLKEDGTVYGFGANETGQLGIGITTTCEPFPVAIPNLKGVVQIVLG